LGSISSIRGKGRRGEGREGEKKEGRKEKKSTSSVFIAQH
jgi:hypothetical protein